MQDSIKKLLMTLGYVPKNGVEHIYYKKYAFHDDYCIEVDFRHQKINYGSQILMGNATTCNFSKPENFVVLECVDRLLEKGYCPENIELEKVYPSGHRHSGNLDIWIKDERKKAYLMIECKTAGSEYTKAYNRTLKDGGQLFSYYAMDRDAQYLCLYSSNLMDDVVVPKYAIIPVEDDWRSLSTSKEIHMHWNKTFKDNGIFEKNVMPYQIKPSALTYEMLKELNQDDSDKIFNHIMEILRHNVVSDKPNAFNKLLNLFVCKIIDENRNPTEELKFQWLEGDTDESLQMRLNDLYKEGMWRFLNIKIMDYSESEIDHALRGTSGDDSSKRMIQKMFRDTVLKKNPNFAFKGVLDEKTFQANAKIVKEIVELLQGYRFRYKQKHPFLGEFFELLLDTSIKQESGQFFTPIPLARFIINSLPLKELIEQKIKRNDTDILPVVIDYAAGSGHFLTEYMEQVQTIINDMDASMAVPSIKNKIKTWVDSEKYVWAKEYVYGIELDDRLVKTAKVSAFFNGDGEANIIWANGLDHFEKSKEYKGKLQQTQDFDKKNNGAFDILISNPPYSVEAFKATLPYGEEAFELYQTLTDNSSEIECLFIERMKQLLKVGGWAGVILPATILTNKGIYAKAREIIFKYFRVKAIVDLDNGTFMKTDTKTIVLFLERREDYEYKEIEAAIMRFFTDTLDVTVAGIENVFSKYVSDVYDGLTFEDYVKIVKGQAVEHELYEKYKKEFHGNTDKIEQLEREKLLYYILTSGQEIVMVKTGKKNEKKRFLGYEFSERRKHEGLKWLSTGTKLYNEKELTDPTKANSYIYHAFCGIKMPVDKSLEKNIFYLPLNCLFEYGAVKFDKRINLNKRERMAINFVTDFPMKKLGDVVDPIKGVNYKKESQTYEETGNVVLTADNLSLDCRLSITKKIYLKEDTKLDPCKKLQKDDIFICFSSGSKKHVGKCALIEEDMDYYAGGFMGILRSKSRDLNMKYLFSMLSSEKIQSVFSEYSTGANINNLSSEMNDINIPLPPLSVQNEIAAKVREIDHTYQTIRMSSQEYCAKVEQIFENYGIKISG